MAAQFIIAEIPLGRRGLNSSNNQAEIQIESLIEANNITYENNLIQKEGGAEKFTSTSTPPLATTVAVIGGWEWKPDQATSRPVILGSNGTYLKDDGSGAFTTATLASGLTATGVVTFVEGGNEAAGRDRKLFMFAGGMIPQVLAGDGASTASVANPPADWLTTAAGASPTFGLFHDNRVWGGGNSNFPHGLYYSSATDHEEFSTADAGLFTVYPGQGETLVGGVSFRGVIFAFKRPRGIYIVDTSDPTITNWSVALLNNNIGLASPRTITQVDLPDRDDVLFMDQNGTFRFLTQVSDEQVQGRDISADAGMDEWMRDNVNFAKLNKARMQYYPNKREVHVLVAEGTATTLSQRIVIDLNAIDGKPRYRLNDRDTAMSDLWLQEDSVGVQRLTMGDEGGIVWNMDQSARAKDAVAYTGVFRTPNHDFGYVAPELGTQRKRFKYVEIEITDAGDHSLLCDVYIDEKFSETVSFNMGGVGETFTYTFPFTFRAVGALTRKRRRIRGSGHRLSLRFYNDGALEDFKVAKCFVAFAPSTRRLEADQ